MGIVIPRFVPFSFRSPLSPSPALTGLYLRVPVLWPMPGEQFLVPGVGLGERA